jgi:hypothetical protein
LGVQESDRNGKGRPVAALTRTRALLGSGLVLVVLTAVVAVLVVRGAEASPPASLPGGATEFGFNAGLRGSHSSSDVERFRANVDDLVANGQTWVRIGIASWVVSTGGSVDGITWSDQGLAAYDQALSYARSKGLHVFLVTSGAPDWAQNFAFSDYVKVSRDYWTFLAQRYRDDVDVWQVFNEADGSDFRQFKPLHVNGLSSSYLHQLKALIGTAGAVIHRANPHVKVTTNASGYPMNDAQQADWFRYFDVLAPVLDMVTVDVYPGTDSGEIDKLGARIATLRARYNKPVSIGEIGISTCRGCSSETDQRTYMPRVIASLKKGAPAVILYYALRDSAGDGGRESSSFGIVYDDGTPKPAYDAIMRAMR